MRLSYSLRWAGCALLSTSLALSLAGAPAHASGTGELVSAVHAHIDERGARSVPDGPKVFSGRGPPVRQRPRRSGRSTRRPAGDHVGAATHHDAAHSTKVSQSLRWMP